MENGMVEVARRDTGEKILLPIAEAGPTIVEMLYNIQSSLLEKNEAMREENTVSVDTWDEFEKAIEDKFVFAHWDGTDETEALIKEKTKATIRCIPFASEDEE